MFSKMRKGKGKDEGEEAQNEWDAVTTEATKQQQQQQQQQSEYFVTIDPIHEDTMVGQLGDSDSSKTRGPKEASVILTGTKQVNVIVKGNKESPLAVPKVPRPEGGAKPVDFSEPRETDPLTKSCTNSTEGSSDVPATVEIDLNDGDGKADVPPSQLNWRQNLAKKLGHKTIGKKLKFGGSGGGGGAGGGNAVGKETMGPPNPIPPPKKPYKLPGFFDFTPPPQTLRLEYKFDEWNGYNLNPEYQDPPKLLTPFNHKVQSVGHKYWGEVFAAIQPVADFAIALFLELLAFVARVTGRLVTGTLLRLTDLFLKPICVFTFNALILPPFVLLANILRALSQATIPLFEMIQRSVEILAIPLAAFRLVEIKNVNYYQTPPYAPPGPETKPPMVEEV